MTTDQMATTSTKIATEVFSVRLSTADKAAITEAARAQGLSRNELIKRLARHAVGELAVPDEMMRAWRDALRQLNGACNNLNQMTRTARRGLLAWREEERAEVRAIHAQVDDLRRLLAAAVQSAEKGRALPARLKRLGERPLDVVADGGVDG